MPYDIYISERRNDATRLRARISLDDKEHSEIFSALSDTRDRYPMIFSMSDFYRDCTYTHGSIGSLMKEITSIKNDSKVSHQMRTFSGALEALAEEANANNQSIYCFSD